MPRYPLQGISALSQLTIDADKDWQTRGITNLKELAAAMAFGDLVARGPAGILVRIPAGPPGLFLTGAGAALPYWGPGGLYLNRYIPANIGLNMAAAVVTPDHTYNKNAPLTSPLVANYDDDINMERIEAAVDSAHAETVIAAPDQTYNKNAPMRGGLSILVDGFVEETAAAVQTDHTAQAREGTANDLNLCPMSDTVLDKIYIGSARPFWQAQVQVGTNGAGNWTNVSYYWNGAWVPTVDENDGSNSFLQGTGLKFITHTPQGDWALSVIQGMNLYWMMVRTDNFVNRATKPLGTQIWVAI
jgi:hypothetical protein